MSGAGERGRHESLIGVRSAGHFFRVECAGRMNWRAHITVDPNVCHGQACVAGTRIPVSVVLDNLASGLAEQEIIASYPRLTPESIQACLAYAADLAREEVVGLPA